MDESKIKELAKSLPFSIDTVRGMVKDYQCIYGRDPIEGDIVLSNPFGLSVVAQLKRKTEIDQKLEDSKKLMALYGLTSNNTKRSHHPNPRPKR